MKKRRDTCVATGEMPTAIPRWLFEINPMSAINSRDFSQILNVKPNNFDYLVRKGSIPPPDFRISRIYIGNNSRFGITGVREWYVKTVIAYLKTLHNNENITVEEVDEQK